MRDREINKFVDYDSIPGISEKRRANSESHHSPRDVKIMLILATSISDITSHSVSL